MKRVDASDGFKEEAFLNAISLTVKEISALQRKDESLLNKIIELGHKEGAIEDEGEGELILIEGPDEKQYLFPVIGLADALSDLY